MTADVSTAMTAPGFAAYRVVLRLDDFLWFASREWGSDNETMPLLHSYALSFAFSGRERIVSVGDVPSYEEDLAQISVYCTPGRLRRDRKYPRIRVVLTFNSIEDPTQLTQALRIGEKVNDPKFGKRQVLVPGLEFELVAFTKTQAALPRVIRLGKKRSPAVVAECVRLKGRRFHGGGTPRHAVNPLDVSGTVVRCIPRAIPPHLVYEEADIEDDDFLRTDEGFVVHLPNRVRAWSA